MKGEEKSSQCVYFSVQKEGNFIGGVTDYVWMIIGAS
jgi:hypothetical protein